MPLFLWEPPIFNPFNLFRKASETAFAIVFSQGSAAVWKPDHFKQFAKEGYQGNVTVYACINEISSAVAGIPWLLFSRGRSDRSRINEITDHKLLSLLARPNPLMGQGSFFEAMTAYLLISGNSFVERVGPDNGLPRELWLIRPDRMTVIPDSVNMIKGYQFKIDGFKKDFLNGEIMHRKTFAPLDAWYGLSPIEVAAKDIDSDGESKRWNISLLKNDMRQPGALIAKGNLGEEQFKRLRAEMQEKYQGAGNAGKPLLLEAGLDWKSFSISQKDADWINGRKMSKREIAQVYQVPGELIGDAETRTYSNYKEARKAFYMETILPFMDRLRDDLNNWLTPLFGDNLFLDYDRDDIEALAPDRDKTFERVARATWLTVNEKRLETGFDEVQGGDVILVPIGLVPLGTKRDEGKGLDWQGLEKAVAAHRKNGNGKERILINADVD